MVMEREGWEAAAERRCASQRYRWASAGFWCRKFLKWRCSCGCAGSRRRRRRRPSAPGRPRPRRRGINSRRCSRSRKSGRRRRHGSVGRPERRRRRRPKQPFCANSNNNSVGARRLPLLRSHSSSSPSCLRLPPLCLWRWMLWGLPQRLSRRLPFRSPLRHYRALPLPYLLHC